MSTTTTEKKVSPQTNGLALWRERQKEEREERMAELEVLRQDAVTIVRGDKEYKVITIPDKYEW